jgi:hypothetical protein
MKDLTLQQMSYLMNRWRQRYASGELTREQIRIIEMMPGWTWTDHKPVPGLYALAVKPREGVSIVADQVLYDPDHASDLSMNDEQELLELDEDNVEQHVAEIARLLQSM